VVEVPSLRLWQAAAEALSRRERRIRRVDASWVLLLVGAILAVLALSGPTWQGERPSRRVRLEVCPSMELASPAAREALLGAVAAMLDRLDSLDRVQLILPSVAGEAGSEGWLSPQDARRRLGALPVIPAGGESLEFAPAPADAQLTYCFVPAGRATDSGPARYVVEIPAAREPLRFTVASAQQTPPGEGPAQLNAFLRVQAGLTSPSRGATLMRQAIDAKGQLATSQPWLALPPLAPGAEARLTPTMPAPDAPAMSLSLAPSAASRELFARPIWLTRRAAAPVKNVAILGQDRPMLRRYLDADPAYQLWADPAAADVIIACQQTQLRALANKPTLWIEPPTPPAGWLAGRRRENILLEAASLAADDPILRGVNLAGIAIRRSSSWSPGALALGKALVLFDDEAIVWRNEPAATPGASRPPRRIAMAFSLAETNTNLAVSEPFVILLANALRWLSPTEAAAADSVRYTSIRPTEAVGWQGWTLLQGGPVDEGKAPAANTLPWPGLYRDRAGEMQAVNVMDLCEGAASQPPAKAVADGPLPEPIVRGVTVTIWPWLAGACLLCWLAGWRRDFR
jgi:hypothetical protein